MSLVKPSTTSYGLVLATTFFKNRLLTTTEPTKDAAHMAPVLLCFGISKSITVRKIQNHPTFPSFVICLKNGVSHDTLRFSCIQSNRDASR